MNSQKSKKPVFFLDIDDCLIHTSALTSKHLFAIASELYKFGVKKAREITQEFAASFRRLYDTHQGKPLTIDQKKQLTKYMKRLAELEKPVVNKFGEIKKWSREVCLFIAGQKYSVNLNNEILVTTSNALWEKITQYAHFYPDAKSYLSKLITRKIPFYLITSSDSRLTKDDRTDLFHYDPVYSRNLKMKRLQKFVDLGVPPEHIFIGDPIDKPKTFVFEEALKFARKEITEPFESVMVSDSYSNDLIPAEKIGMEKRILLVRTEHKRNNVPPHVEIISSLVEINL